MIDTTGEQERSITRLVYNEIYRCPETTETVAMTQHLCATPAELLDEKYRSDDFRLYCFKVLPCSQKKHHDWTKCPFAHVGERAKRRSLRTHIYDCEMCPAVTKGEECNSGASCPHSHNAFESWLHPQKYRTLLCKDGHKCDKYVCFFAHGVEELRVPCNPQTTLPTLADVQIAAGINRSSSSDTVISSLRPATNPSVCSSPGYTAPSHIYSPPAEAAAGRAVGHHASSPSMQTIALLIEQVQEARRMAQESREAAAQAETQLRLMTDAMLSRATAEPLQATMVSPTTQLLPTFTIIDNADSTLLSQPLDIASAGQQLSTSSSTYMSLAAPAGVSSPAVPSQLSWGTSCLPLSSPMLGGVHNLVPTPAGTASVVGLDMPAGLYGSSSGLRASQLSAAFDVHHTAATGAPPASQNHSAPLCVLLSQPQQPQQQVVYQAAAAGDVLQQGVYGEILQGSPCSSSTMYYF